jgi:hypothetical protein
VTLWIGERLGAIERACLRSMLRHGHEVRLHCYGRPAGVPDGVEIADAADILPESAIIRQNGSPAPFANRFRYELLRRGLGTWLDCDVYLLKPLDMERPYLMGVENDKGTINNGVLRMPADSPLLPPLLALFEERSVPRWIGRRARIAAAWRLLTTGRSGLARMPWGASGPLALTALARRHGLAGEAQPQEVFHLGLQDPEWIRDPARPLETMATPRTVAIHLWNFVITPFKELPAPAGSFLARLQQEGR